MLVAILSIALASSLFYNLKLARRLRGYEHVWEQIEQVADHNQDGTFTINIQHMEEHHPSNTSVNAPNVRVLDLSDLSSADDTPPRAA
jgi:hypothetical protein